MNPRLQKRRHPDGSPLYDVFVDGRSVGVVRQKPGVIGWFGFDLRSDSPVVTASTRRDCITALLQAVG